MAITRATDLSSVGSGLGTNPAQPIQVGIAVTIDGSTGILSATTFVGSLTGTASTTSFATTSANAQGLTGSPNITVGDIIAGGGAFSDNVNILGAGIIVGTAVTAVDANFTGNVSIAGTLTYEDVTNIDSVGLITARNGLQVLAGITTISGQTNLANVSVSAASTFSGKISANSGVGFTGFLREGVNIISGKLSDNTTINIDHSMVHYFTTTETTTGIPNFTSTAGINTDLSVGQTFSVNVITTAAAAGYSTGARIDAGATLPVLWNGGSDPSEGGSAGVDLYTYQVIKTGSAAFTVLGNVSNFA